MERGGDGRERGEGGEGEGRGEVVGIAQCFKYVCCERWPCTALIHCAQGYWNCMHAHQTTSQHLLRGCPSFYLRTYVPHICNHVHKMPTQYFDKISSFTIILYKYTCTYCTCIARVL